MIPFKSRVLLADDDEEDRALFQDALSALDLATELHTVADGQQLMDYFESGLSELPHILFLDLDMPCKNGAECLKAIRSNGKLKDVTVAIYSSSGSEKDIEEAFVHGANVYIRKPSDFADLKRVLSQVLDVNWKFESEGLNKATFLFSI